jgi:hypothetical protein
MVYKINPDLIDASETKLQQLAKQSSSASIHKLMKIARILMQTESDIRQLGNERLNLELAMVRLSDLRDDDIPLAEALDMLKGIESRLTSGDLKAAPVVAESESMYSEAAASIEEQDEPIEYDESHPLRATWYKLLEAIKKKRLPALHAFLIEASPVSIDDDSLTIDFEPKFNLHREHVQETENKKRVEAELSELMGKPMKLRIKPSQNSENSERTPASQRDMKRDAQQDESVKLILDVFNGRIVDVKQ